ncbi:MAG: hypothetical protein AMS27_17980 [Bacteroides sp. SM23_62_1]|nr:MAG: hypothetical protein AMS27_17980 [Bacteroides sp. SM23_62_1]
MRNISILVIIIACLVYPGKGSCQADFRPGYIITLENDTIHGLIDFRGDMINAQICSFKKHKKAEKTNYKPFEIKAYRFTGDKYYISRYVKQTEETVPVFIEYLVDGIADLYYYRDTKNIDHYFIEKEDSTLVELTNERKMIVVDNGHYKGYYDIQTRRHIGILKYFSRIVMKSSPSLTRHTSTISL